VLPDLFLDHDSPAVQHDTARLTAKYIVATVLDALGIKDKVIELDQVLWK